MPNLKVLQDQPEQLKSQLYGFDGANVRPLLTDGTGRTDIRPLTSATDNISVVASSLDIRPLTAADQVSIIASDLDIRPLDSATDSVTTVTSVSHAEPAPVAVTTTNTYAGAGEEVATWRTFSFFVENTSETAASATIKVQISPDNTKWVDDSAEYTLAQAETTVLVTSRYLRYARVAYKSAVDDAPADLSIAFQAQN